MDTAEKIIFWILNGFMVVLSSLWTANMIDKGTQSIWFNWFSTTLIWIATILMIIIMLIETFKK